MLGLTGPARTQGQRKNGIQVPDRAFLMLLQSDFTKTRLEGMRTEPGRRPDSQDFRVAKRSQTGTMYIPLQSRDAARQRRVAAHADVKLNCCSIELLVAPNRVED